MSKSLVAWARACDGRGVDAMPGMTIMTLLAAKNNLNAIFTILQTLDESTRTTLVNTPDAYGNTLLHYFALIQNDSALKALVSLGASTTHENHACKTPGDVHKSKSLDLLE